MIGKKFGRLLVLEKGTSKNKRSFWECLCDCGTSCTIMGKYLRNGDTKSCGCLAFEETIKRNTKHGLCNTRIYNTWCNIINRCYNKNNPAYKNYGGRGISMCDEWRKSFEDFYYWSMENSYTDLLTIDRINNDKGYFPENCRFVNKKIQNNNRRVKKSHSNTGFKYINKNKSNTFTVCVFGKYLGCFKSLEDAIKIRNEYAINNNLSLLIKDVVNAVL